jgi:hypothetical protein
MPSAVAARMTSFAPATASAMLLLMFFFEWASLAEMNTAASCSPASRARESPLRFGTSALKTTPSLRPIRRRSSSASASWGIHFGETKEVTSMRFSPAATSASTSRALSRVGSVRSSFCRPSRGPTS